MNRPPTPSRVHPVVVALEDTPAAAGVLATAGALASRLSAPLLPARVVGRVDAPSATVGAPAGRLAPPLEGIPLLEGIPAIEIVRFAESRRARLLILGAETAGEGGMADLKELADAVVRRAEVPCLILPAGQGRLGRMVVALDGSERGMQALRTAWSLREIQDGKRSAVFVTSGAGERAGVVGPPEALAQQIGARVTGTVGPGSGIAVVHRRGDVVEEVLEGLSADDGDLLVVGVRRGGPADPSESTGNGRRLLAAAPCAVLTVPL